MFGSKKKEASKTTGLIPSSTHSLNSLVQGTEMEGDLKCENDIRVDGSIKGNLICAAKVIIGPQGTIVGDVKCKNAVIEGTFDGTLQVEELLDIKESAKLKGEIYTDKLKVQSGAVFNVACSMGNSLKVTDVPPTNGAVKKKKEAKVVG